MERRCYQYQCQHYPDCLYSGGSCCAVEIEEERTLKPEDCYLLPDKPLYTPGRSRQRWKPKCACKKIPKKESQRNPIVHLGSFSGCLWDFLCCLYRSSIGKAYLNLFGNVAVNSTSAYYPYPERLHTDCSYEQVLLPHSPVRRSKRSVIPYNLISRRKLLSQTGSIMPP